MKYQKRPLPVTAIMWTGINRDDVRLMIITHGGRVHFDHTGQALLTTYNGDTTAKTGWWIVVEPGGKFFAGDQKWFDESYEKVPVKKAKDEELGDGKTA